MRLRSTGVALVIASVGVAGQQGAEQPRFRAGANLVRVDAYVSKDGTPVTDLTAGDVEVFEDDQPQKIESFELVTRRPPIPQSARVDPTNVAAAREVASAAGTRLFTLFFDTLHVSIDGSYRAQNPVIEALDRAIGADDLIGAMTPEMSPSNIVFGRRTTSIERFVRDTWHWGERDRMLPTNEVDQDLLLCFPDTGNTAGIAAEMVLRRREQRTLDALDGLVTHLEGLRPDRKFVIVFTEGWPLYQRDERLARVIDDVIPGGPDRIGIGPGGRLTKRQDQPGPSPETCDRQRIMLAYIDHAIELRQLLQRANRANVSFYPVDARGLVVFDRPIGGSLEKPLPPSIDAALLRNRQDALRMMADQTDGAAVLNTNAVGAALQRILADVGSYYLMSYYSTNSKLDGRFRRISVRVKREGFEVRARPGYLAPTEAEARAAGATLPDKSGRLTPTTPPSVTRALDALAPARGNLPVRIQATGGAGAIRAIVELDQATLKLPEWASGGDLRLSIEGERGGQSYTINSVLEPGQRSVTTLGPETPLAAGRYMVKAELTARGARLPLQVTTFAVVPADTATIGTAALALRRGPSTGLAYQPTADSRFRRTERIRIEVPLLVEEVITTGRMLNREGQPMPLTVATSQRAEGAMKLAMAEVILAPLAAGEYVLELSCAAKSGTETISYGFRIVP
ncbi:MAG: VWA domain-containing protein [Vicinamibacterales bacterium]